MSKLTNCPNCGAKWSYEEQETDSCDTCNYPDHVTACGGSCDSPYCADNGCLEKPHILAGRAIPLKHNDDD